jgi:hypothetical protein
MVIQATRRGGVLSLLSRGVDRDKCTVTYWDDKPTRSASGSRPRDSSAALS